MLVVRLYHRNCGERIVFVLFLFLCFLFFVFICSFTFFFAAFLRVRKTFACFFRTGRSLAGVYALDGKKYQLNQQINRAVNCPVPEAWQ